MQLKVPSPFSLYASSALSHDGMVLTGRSTGRFEDIVEKYANVRNLAGALHSLMGDGGRSIQAAPHGTVDGDERVRPIESHQSLICNRSDRWR